MSIRKKTCNVTYQLNEKKLKVLRCYDCSAPLKQKDAANQLKMPLTTFNYYFKELQKKKLINEENHITEKGKQVIQYFNYGDRLPPLKLRAHKVQLKFFIQKIDKNFHKIKNIILKPFTNHRYKGYKTTFKDCEVLFYSEKKVIVYLPEIIGKNYEEILRTAKDLAVELREDLEDLFKEYGLVFLKQEIAKFESMHIAIVDSLIAENFLNENNSHFHGKIAVDNSKGHAELEVEDINTINENLELICKYEDLVRENLRLKKELDLFKKK